MGSCHPDDKPALTPGKLPVADSIQAVEIVHAEEASRVRDQPLVPQTDQLGADHGACRADEFGQVMMAQPDVDRVAVLAALPLEADRCPLAWPATLAQAGVVNCQSNRRSRNWARVVTDSSRRAANSASTQVAASISPFGTARSLRRGRARRPALSAARRIREMPLGRTADRRRVHPGRGSAGRSGCRRYEGPAL